MNPNDCVEPILASLHLFVMTTKHNDDLSKRAGKKGSYYMHIMHKTKHFRLRFLVGLILLVPLALIITRTPQVAHAQITHQPLQQGTAHFMPHRGQVVPAVSSSLLVYHGGPVMAGTSKVYTIFWQPTNNVAGNYQSLINRYFNDVGTSPLYGLNVEYPQGNGAFPSNSVLAGTWTDTRAYPGSPGTTLTDGEIQDEVSNALLNNSTWQPGLNAIFFVFLQKNEDICFSGSECASNSFCAYHSFFNGNIIYAAMPYAASFNCNSGGSPNFSIDADQTINVASHEQMEAATDPQSNAWYDTSGSSSGEIGDKCAWNFGPRNGINADVIWNGDPYLVQNEFNNTTNTCLLAAATTVSSGGNTLYSLSPAKDGVWQYSGSNATWIKIGGPARAIYGGGAGLFATDPATGNLYQYLGTPMSWRQIAGPVLSVTVSNYDVFIQDNLGVWQWNGVPGSWDKIDNPVGALYVGDIGIFATDPYSGYLFQYWAGTWRQIAGPAMSVAISDSGLFLLDSQGVWSWTGIPGDWTKIGDSSGALYAGNAGVFATDILTGNLYQYSGTPMSWGQIAGRVWSVATSDSHVFLHDNLGVWQWNGVPGIWNKIGGPAYAFTLGN